MTSHVYLLMHKNGSRFKIGKADHVLSRIDQIGQKKLDIARCQAVSTENSRDAFELERWLHRLFSHERINPRVIREEGEGHSGDTEWFSASCHARATKFIEENLDIFRGELLRGESFPCRIKPPVKHNSWTDAESVDLANSDLSREEMLALDLKWIHCHREKLEQWRTDVVAGMRAHLLRHVCPLYDELSRSGIRAELCGEDGNYSPSWRYLLIRTDGATKDEAKKIVNKLRAVPAYKFEGALPISAATPFCVYSQPCTEVSEIEKTGILHFIFEAARRSHAPNVDFDDVLKRFAAFRIAWHDPLNYSVYSHSKHDVTRGWNSACYAYRTVRNMKVGIPGWDTPADPFSFAMRCDMEAV